MGVSRVSRKWLTTVPVDVRKALKVEEGNALLWRFMEKEWSLSEY